MEPMKQVKSALGGVTINDIVSTATGRAVWKYMAHVYERERDKYVGSLPPPNSWSLSELQGVSLWLSVPRKFGNKVGAARIWNPLPEYLLRQEVESNEECQRESIIRNLVAKRSDIYLHMKRLKLPVVFQCACKLLPNNLPASVANLLLQPPKTSSYLMTNVRSMPVNMTCMGQPVTFMIPFPQLFGSAGEKSFKNKQ
jgi:hypothetical protein